MGCGDSGCHGPSLAYMAAADISSRSSSKEDSHLYANLTAISDMLKSYLEDARNVRDEAEYEYDRRRDIVEHLESALGYIEDAQAA